MKTILNTWPRRAAFAVAAVAAIMLGFGGASAIAATTPHNTGAQANGTVLICVAPSDGGYYAPPRSTPTKCPTGYAKLVINIKGATGATGARGLTGIPGHPGNPGVTGPQGPAGPAGTSAVLTVNATTALTDRHDSGHSGDWSVESFVRSASITRQHASAASKCGASATVCWFYTGTITDSGSGLSIDGASSPEAGTAINGRVSYTFTGGSSFEFYADSDAPNASLMPAGLTGNGQSTSTWMHQFFPGGTHFASDSEPKWGWTYAAAATCEVWTDTSTGDTGDLVGVNHCA